MERMSGCAAGLIGEPDIASQIDCIRYLAVHRWARQA
jgi:hypothetical protein